MSAADALMKAKQVGITVSVDGGGLNLEAEAEPLVPTEVTATMMTTAIKAAMRPYLMAVTPD